MQHSFVLEWPLKVSTAKRDSLYLYTRSTWTNQTLEDELCAYEELVGELFVGPYDDSDARLFALPECFFAIAANLTAFRGENLIISGNISDSADPLLRLPGGLSQLSLSGVALMNPTLTFLAPTADVTNTGSSIKVPYSPNWESIFNHFETVSSLALVNVGLEGTLPASLSQQVWQFSVANNSLSGTIPEALLSNVNDTASAVEINVSGNKLSGSLPENLLQSLNSAAESLRSIYVIVSRNQLTGSISSQFLNLNSMDNLYQLAIDLGENQFTGNLDASFFTSAALNAYEAKFDLSLNALAGTIPSNIFAAASSRLSGLSVRLDSNLLTGTIPDLWSGLTGANESLRQAYFYLAGNDITGSVPATFSPSTGFENLASIVFDLGDNSISGTIPSGLLGPEIDSINSIEINLSGNDLSGTVAPLQVNENLETLIFSLGSNSLTGALSEDLLASIPSGLSNLELDLSWNELSGTIPESLLATYINTTLTNRYLTLNLAHCGLTGSIPSPIIGDIRGLSISVDGNALDGTLPSTLLEDHSNLYLIDLSAANNNLAGEVTLPELQNNYLVSLRLSNNKLTKLNIDASVAYVEVLDVSLNADLKGALPEVLFANNSQLVVLNATRTALSGDFLIIGGFVEAPLATLDLSFTAINFCSSDRTAWLASSLTSCDLTHTNASSCSGYPQVCAVGNSINPSTPQAITPSSSPASATVPPSTDPSEHVPTSAVTQTAPCAALLALVSLLALALIM